MVGMTNTTVQAILAEIDNDGIAVQNLGSVFTLSVELPSDSGSGRSYSVDVFRPRTAYGENVPASVNWGGIGSKSADDAEAYAHVLGTAARLAAALNAEAAS